MRITIDKMERDAKIHIIYYVILYVVLMLAIINLLNIDNLNIYMQIIVAVFLVFSIVRFIVFIKKHISYYSNEKNLRTKGIRVKAVLDKKAFCISSDRIMEVCRLTAYYTQGEKTYIFKDDIWYFGPTISIDLLRMKKEDRLLSQIDVLIDPEDCKKYVVLKYNYLYDLFESNGDLY